MLALYNIVLPNTRLVFSDRAYVNPHFPSVAQGFDSSLEVGQSVVCMADWIPHTST
jgi:hypothetical protein